MKIQLINPPNPEYSGLQQVLHNRGIADTDMYNYINTTDDNINSPLLLNEESLHAGAVALISMIQQNESILIVVDPDCDGMTSAALLINYLHKQFPYYTENYVHWYIHDGKAHGLIDCLDVALTYKMVICPDSSSNDYSQHHTLKTNGITVLVMDHHEAEKGLSEDAIVINNQLSEYPNKQLSGAGVTWQFCRYLDSKLNTDYANQLLDLVALGNMADMMSLLSIETKHLINKGFEPDNVVNPFIYNMWQKNSYKLGDHITPWGAAFYIAPLVNAIVRSGTLAEKELVFESMLEFKAYEQILSTKRGHKPGEMEPRIAAALRTCTNVKNHQTKAEQEGLELLENRIIDNNMLSHKVLLFLIEPGQIEPNIAGLVANRLMGKYQRPVCVLTHSGNSYSGSARGCDKVGVTQFKDNCSDTNLTTFVAGHQGAFGLGIMEENIDKFLARTDIILADMPDTAVYYCDYVFQGTNVNEQIILDVGQMDAFWGKDFDQSLVAIKNLKITKEMVTLLSPDKSPTLKIKLPTCTLMKFNSSEEEYNKFISEGYVEANIVGTCNINNWMGNISAQLLISDYEIIDNSSYYF